MREQKILLEADFQNAARYYTIAFSAVLACTVVAIPLIIFIAPLVYIIRKIEYDRIRCFLTDRTLVVHRGVLNKREQTIPLEKITDLAIAQGPIMRMCGIEAISVETAGQSGAGGALINLVGIKDARAFRDSVLEQRDRLRGLDDDMPTPTTTTSPTTPTIDNSVLVEIRDSLLRIERGLADRSDT